MKKLIKKILYKFGYDVRKINSEIKNKSIDSLLKKKTFK